MNDPKLCDAILSPDHRDSCYLDFAELLNVFTPCDSIVNQSKKGLCYGFFTPQGNSLGSSSSVGSDIKAMAASSSSRVKEIKPIESAPTATGCESIQSEPGRDLCYFGIANNTSNAHICEQRIMGISYRNQCFSMVGGQNKDVSLCAKITADDISDVSTCYSAIALNKNDPSICEMIKDEWWKSPCYFDIAFRYKDSTLCEKITLESVKTQCLSYKWSGS